MKPLLTLCLFLICLTGAGQTPPPRRDLITVGSLNVALMVYANGKQFIPVNTQRWLNWCVYTPVIGFTVIKAFEYGTKKPERVSYRKPKRNNHLSTKLSNLQ